MRVGFHYHVEVVQQADGTLLMPPYLGRFIDALAHHYGHLVAFLHRHPNPSVASDCTYACQADNLDIVLLPPKRDYLNRILRAREYIKSVVPFRHRLDGLILRVPTPLAWFVWRALGCLPTGLLIVGDLIESGKRVPLALHKKLLGLVLSHVDLWLLMHIARKAVVATNGPELAARWRRRVGYVIEAATGTLHESELHYRDNHFQRSPVRLLFVGRNSREKGVEDLIKAAAQLIRGGLSVAVEIAGIERDSSYGTDLAALAMAYGICDNVRFHGFVKLEPDLLHLYDDADVMVIPSRWEGVPRVLWEAMGRGCLVVTTQVGGITLVTQHERECLHVRIGRPDKIAEAILRLRQDIDLRRRLVAAGIEQARRHTIERTVAGLVQAFGQADPRLAPIW